MRKSKEIDTAVGKGVGAASTPPLRKKSTKGGASRQSIAERASSKGRSISKESVTTVRSSIKSATPIRSSVTSRVRSNSPRLPTKPSPRKSSIPSPKATPGDELSIEINAWLQRMKLSKVVRNPKQDFSNGYLVAEIFHHHLGPGGAGEVKTSAKFKKHLPPLTRFLKTSNRQAKLDNWAFLGKAAKKLGLSEPFPSQSDIDCIILGKKGVAVRMVRRLYEYISAGDGVDGDLGESIGDVSLGVTPPVVASSSMVVNIETVPEHAADSHGLEAGEAVLVEVVSEEALKWADREEAKLEEEQRDVVFGAVSSAAELDEDHVNRRLSLMGQLQGSVGRGRHLRRILSNREAKEEEGKATQEKAKEERRKRRLLRGGVGTIDVDSDCESDEEEEREAMGCELRSLLGSDSVVSKESALHGSRVATAADVHKGAALGRGRFACVFAGVWRPPTGSGGTDVAVKEFMFVASRKTAPLPVQRVFHREARTLATLAHHPKVMDLVGVVLVPRPMILLELLDVGSLFDVMHGETVRAQWQAASMREKLGLLVDISEGLSHLHAASLLHGDLKSHNVLVGLRQRRGEHAGVSLLQAKLKRQLEGWGDADGSLPAREEGLVWIAKLGDLGTVAKIPAPDEPPLLLEVGTSGWMAPEVCAAGPTGSRGYGLSADVWSFGVVLWECFGDHHRMDPFKPGTGLWRGDSNPFAGIAAEGYLRRLQEGERWPLTLTDDDEEVTIDTLTTSFEHSGDLRSDGPIRYVSALQEVAANCWHLDPSKRPLVNRISHNLHSIADSLVS